MKDKHTQQAVFLTGGRKHVNRKSGGEGGGGGVGRGAGGGGVASGRPQVEMMTVV